VCGDVKLVGQCGQLCRGLATGGGFAHSVQGVCCCHVCGGDAGVLRLRGGKPVLSGVVPLGLGHSHVRHGYLPFMETVMSSWINSYSTFW
jgi:hypothetical protein